MQVDMENFLSRGFTIGQKEVYAFTPNLMA
jgi:hypothetical protein